MGTGKTIQAIAIAYCYREEWPLLIICPSSLKYMWREELIKWLPSIPHIEIITNKKYIYKDTAQIFIMSYSCAKDLLPLWQKDWKVIISDESHFIKNRDAKRTKVLVPILIKAKRAIMLSGTPMLGRPMDIYNCIHALRPDIFRTFREFGHRYCDPKRGTYGIDWKGSSNTEELRLILNATLFIRRLKEEVLTELPRKQKQEIIIEADEKQEKKIRKVLSKFTAKEIHEAFIEDTPNTEEIRRSLMTAYKLTGKAKLNASIEFLRNLIENERKFLFYAQHIEVLDGVEEVLKEQQIDYIRIDGNIPIIKRNEFINTFQQTPSYKAALLSLTAANYGITLTAANTVVFGEYNWTPGIMDQAEERVHRVGQVNAVNVYYLHAENTLDNMIRGIIREKKKIITEVMDNKKEYKEFQFITRNIEPKAGYIRSVSKLRETKIESTIKPKSVGKEMHFNSEEDENIEVK